MKPTITCLTPVKNEEWILHFFLNQTSKWADKIILADQYSTDRTVQIINKAPKTKLITNSKTKYDEKFRQQLLLDHARKQKKDQILFALDADEILSIGYETTADWQLILKSKPGTAFYFRLVNLLPDLKHFWSPPLWFNFAYHDDGAAHYGKTIHSPRLPLGRSKLRVYLNKIKVFHLQYLTWNRMEQKQKWYQCQEKMNKREINPIGLYRQYHHMDTGRRNSLKLPPDSLDRQTTELLAEIVDKSKNNMDYNNLLTRLITKEVLNNYSDLAIWPIDGLPDPRGIKQKLLHGYLKYSQPYTGNFFIRHIDNRLSKICYR